MSFLLDWPCAKCKGVEHSEANDMVFCDRCNNCYHQQCHPGLETIPKRRWYCRRCMSTPSASPPATPVKPTPEQLHAMEPRKLRSGKRTLCQRETEERGAQGHGETTCQQQQQQQPQPDDARDEHKENVMTNSVNDLEGDLIIQEWTETEEPSEDVKLLYRVITRSTGAMSSGGGGSIYGEMTLMSMQRVLTMLVRVAGLDANSKFIDIGAGLGKPSLHAALYPGVAVSFGVEVEALRWQLSLLNLATALKDVPKLRSKKHASVCFEKADAMMLRKFDPFTHVFMFDLAFPPELMLSLAQAFNNSTTAQHIISFRPPREFLLEYGFSAELVARSSARLSGSSESHLGYLYRKTDTPLTMRPSNEVQELENSYQRVTRRKLAQAKRDASATMKGGCTDVINQGLAKLKKSLRDYELLLNSEVSKHLLDSERQTRASSRHSQ